MEAQAVPREAATGGNGMLSPRFLRLASDARLVALIRAGNAAAFEAVYDRYQGQIMSFCRHMLGDPEEAADAVQHTFLAAYNAIVSSEKTLLLRAWLFTIARNRCYSVLRAKREQPAGDLVEPYTEGLAVQVQQREELRQLLSDMRQLPDDQRAALILAELDTLNHQEIGTALGVPPAKVKALVFQARESLTASRAARDTDCSEIRLQLSTMRGGALRRGNLRRHLRECQGCREYRTQVELQRRSLAAILPVAPSLALKDAVMAGISGTGSTTGIVAGGGLLASSALKGVAAKALIGGLLALVGIGGTIVAVHAAGARRHAGAVTASGTIPAQSVSGERVSASKPVADPTARRPATQFSGAHRGGVTSHLGAARDIHVLSAGSGVLGVTLVRPAHRRHALRARRHVQRTATAPPPAAQTAPATAPPATASPVPSLSTGTAEGDGKHHRHHHHSGEGHGNPQGQSGSGGSDGGSGQAQTQGQGQGGGQGQGQGAGQGQGQGAGQGQRQGAGQGQGGGHGQGGGQGHGGGQGNGHGADGGGNSQGH